MAAHKTFYSLPLVATALLVLIGSLSSVNSFTIAPSRVAPTHRSPISTKLLPTRQQLQYPISSSTTNEKSTTSLHMNFSSPGDNDPGGLNEGKYILVIAMILSIWLFSIPPEFRRARLCKEEDVQLYPEKHCTTFKSWRTGVAEYYSNGGGVHFDFSIEGKE